MDRAIRHESEECTAQVLLGKPGGGTLNTPRIAIWKTDTAKQVVLLVHSVSADNRSGTDRGRH